MTDEHMYKIKEKTEWNEEKRTWKMPPFIIKQKEINKLGLDASFISYPTALMTKLFTMMIPRINDRGVFPPETLEPEIVHDILEELKKHIKFIER